MLSTVWTPHIDILILIYWQQSKVYQGIEVKAKVDKRLSGKNGNERIVSITIITITITITIIIVMIIFVESSGPPVEVEVGNTQALGLILV